MRWFVLCLTLLIAFGNGHRVQSTVPRTQIPSLHTARSHSKTIKNVGVHDALKVLTMLLLRLDTAAEWQFNSALQDRTFRFHSGRRTPTGLISGSVLSRSVACYHLRRKLSDRRYISMQAGASDDGTPAAANIIAALGGVQTRLEKLAKELELAEAPRLVAVSKTKPVEQLKVVYDAGQRDFGENYAQELIEKAALMPDDVRWHFIGHLQSNKAKSLVQKVPGLTCVETVDSVKLARKLDAACDAAGRTTPLDVMLQINTSGEDSKSGLTPGDDVVALAQQVRDDMPRLRLAGLMTIGAPGDSSAFDVLVQCREQVAAKLGQSIEDFELSMGMSGDFEDAVRHGSTSVRVGSTIFGARDYASKV